MTIKKPFTLQSPLDAPAVSVLDQFLESVAKAIVVPGVRMQVVLYKGDGKSKRAVEIGFFPSFAVIQKVGFPSSYVSLVSLSKGVVLGAFSDILEVNEVGIIVGSGINVNAIGMEYKLLAIGTV